MPANQKNLEKIIAKLKDRVINLESTLQDVGYDVPSQNVEDDQLPLPWAEQYLRVLENQLSFPGV